MLYPKYSILHPQFPREFSSTMIVLNALLTCRACHNLLVDVLKIFITRPGAQNPFNHIKLFFQLRSHINSPTDLESFEIPVCSLVHSHCNSPCCCQLALI